MLNENYILDFGVSSKKIWCAGEKSSSYCPSLTDQMNAPRKIRETIRLAPSKISITLIEKL